MEEKPLSGGSALSRAITRGANEKGSDAGRRLPVRSLSMPAHKPQAVGRIERRRQGRVWPGDRGPLPDQTGKGAEDTGTRSSPKRSLWRTQTSVGPRPKQRSAGSTGWGSLLWARPRGGESADVEDEDTGDAGLGGGQRGSPAPGARRSSWLWQKLQTGLFGSETGRGGTDRAPGEGAGAGNDRSKREGAVWGVGGDSRSRRGRQVSWDMPLAHAQSAVRELSSGLDVVYEGGGGEHGGFKDLGLSGAFSPDIRNSGYHRAAPVVLAVRELLLIDVAGAVVDVIVGSETGLDLRAGFQEAAVGWTPDYLTIPQTISGCGGKMNGEPDSIAVGEPVSHEKKLLDMLTASGVAARVVADLANFHSSAHPTSLGDSSRALFGPLAASLLAHGSGSASDTSPPVVHPILLEPVRMRAPVLMEDVALRRKVVHSLDVAVVVGPCMALPGGAVGGEPSQSQRGASAPSQNTGGDAAGPGRNRAGPQVRAPHSLIEGSAAASDGDGSRRRERWRQAIAQAGGPAGAQESMEWRMSVRRSGLQAEARHSGIQGGRRRSGGDGGGGGGTGGGERGEIMDGLQVGLQLDVQVRAIDHVPVYTCLLPTRQGWKQHSAMSAPHPQLPSLRGIVFPVHFHALWLRA